MEKINNLKKLFATVAIAAVSISASFGQSDIGQACGCPPLASRPIVNVSGLTTSLGTTGGQLTNLPASPSLLFHWDCAHTYYLDEKIYVPKGGVLTVDPGTVIEGKYVANPANAVALIVTKGAKMYAVGTPDCPIVMTSENDVNFDGMNGGYGVKNDKQWGGLVIAGYGINCLTLAKNGPFQPHVGDGKLCVEDGVGTFEGFATSYPGCQFGAQQSIGEVPDDHDNSGIYRYLSVRYSGAILEVGSEINGISLGSVGDGTTMDHIEVISSGDDNMEFWGGTVNVKYADFLFGNDDMYDTDDGYRGKTQFLFAVSASTNDTTVVSPDSDNGFEVDADDQQSGNYPRSHQICYNTTMVRNNKHVMTSDNTGMAAIMAKELTEGEWYNSIFINFPEGLNLWTGGHKANGETPPMPANLIHAAEGTRVATADGVYGLGGNQVVDCYDNWYYGDIKCKNNTFVHCLAPLALDCGKKVSTLSYLQCSYVGNPAWHTPSTSDLAKFASDGNVAVASVPGINFNWAMDGTTNVVSTKLNVVPTTDIPSSITPPADGFFSPVTYRGAFKAGEKSWLTGWTYASILGNITGTQPCPTDINGDGQTDVNDFIEFLGGFGKSCNQ